MTSALNISNRTICGNIDSPGEKIQPIFDALNEGDEETIRKFICNGNTVNLVDSNNYSLLMKASKLGSIRLVELLLFYGADPNAVNRIGGTALMYASQEGHLPVCEVLLKRSVGVLNHCNIRGMTSLVLASLLGHHQVVDLLVRYGALIDEKTLKGQTALMMACHKGHFECVKILTSAGAEIYHVSDAGCTAIDIATSKNHLSLLQLLDTQSQMKQIQRHHHKVRKELLLTLRLAALQNKIIQIVNTDNCSTSNAVTKRHSHDLSSANQGSEWSSVMHRILHLPPGLGELVLDYLPTPRIWEYALDKLVLRSCLCPAVAVADLFRAMDEILCDANIISGGDQKHMLVKISQSSQIRRLLEERYMSPRLIAKLCSWADTQERVGGGLQEVHMSTACGVLVTAHMLLDWLL